MKRLQIVPRKAKMRNAERAERDYHHHGWDGDEKREAPGVTRT